MGSLSRDVNWDAYFDSIGAGWFCGTPVVPDPIPGVVTIDELASWTCGTWHDTREAREACDHGGTGHSEAGLGEDASPAPIVPPPVETTIRPNRFAGSCLWCGGNVAANGGRLVDHHGVMVPAHKDGDCG